MDKFRKGRQRWGKGTVSISKSQTFRSRVFIFQTLTMAYQAVSGTMDIAKKKKTHLKMTKTFQWESVAIKSDEVARSVLRNVCALEKHNWEAREQKLSLLTEVVSKHLDTWMAVTASLQNCSVLNSLDALSRNFLLRTVTAVVWASHPC